MTIETAERQIERVMELLPYGLYIVGSQSDTDVNGMLAHWVMEVSFHPRLVAVALENDAHTLENVRGHRFFSINVLSQDSDSMHLASKFAQPYYGSKVKGRGGEAVAEIHRKLEGIPHSRTDHGCPVLDVAMAWVECQVEALVPAGDHTLVIGRVIDGLLLRDAEPLTSSYTGWTYSG